MANVNWKNLSWPPAQLGEALHALAQAARLAPREVDTPNPPPIILAVAAQSEQQFISPALHEWVEAAADFLGFEAEPIEATYAEIEKLVRGAGPALLRLPDHSLLAVLKCGSKHATILAPDLKLQRVSIATVGDELRRPHEEPLTTALNHLLKSAGVAPARQGRARAAILREQLSQKIAGGGWLLRLPPGAGFIRQLRQAGLLRELLAPLWLHAAHYALLLIAWWMLGRGALNGQLDRGWLAAWALLLLTAVPFHLLAVRAQGRFAVGAGALLKRRLLYGALRLEPEEIRHQGTGQLLGRVTESNTIETLALNGGFLVLTALIEITLALLVLGAAGWRLALLLAVYIGATLLIIWRYFQRRGAWTGTRLAMTNDLVERMVGHRTRLAQETPERWHEGEDQTVERYLTQSLKLDGADVWQVLTPRGWLTLGLCGLAVIFVVSQTTPTVLAVSVGGILLGFRGLQKLVASLTSLFGATIAWRQIAEIFRAAAREETHGAPAFAVRQATPTSLNDQAPAPMIVEAHDVTFRYRERGHPILQGCSLEIRAGDRLLLQGSSGGGKSTFASLLTGLRRPESGLLLAGGLDHQTIGYAGWRRRITAAPQFHENHVVTGTFAFNLLMGRGWPPTDKDFRAAEELCHALGLGELLQRMPAGLSQMVGETGWQLSHGERSRVFMARALLQGADLVILDESFGALDPETLRQCLGCALERVPTLLVIAHP